MLTWKRDPAKGLIIGTGIIAHAVSTVQYIRIYPAIKDVSDPLFQLVAVLPFPVIPALWMVLLSYAYFWYTDVDEEDDEASADYMDNSSTVPEWRR